MEEQQIEKGDSIDTPIDESSVQEERNSTREQNDEDRTTSPLSMICVVNPFASSGRMRNKWPQLEKELKEKLKGVQVSSLFTQYKAHAIEATREAILNGANIIFGAGGDGTLNEIINGLFYPKTHPKANGKPFVLINSNIKFCYFPAGTGTDFFKTISVPSTIDQVVDSINNNKTVLLDVGLVEYTNTLEQQQKQKIKSNSNINQNQENQSFNNSQEENNNQQYDHLKGFRYFANVASAGIGGEVDPLSEKLRSRWISGKVTYAISSVIALLSTRTRDLRIRLDDDDEWKELKGTNVAVCNGKIFGGGMIVGPFADPTDGLFNVTVWNATLSHFVLHNSDLYSGAHMSWNETQLFNCQKLEVDLCSGDEERHGEFRLDIDGEGEGKTPAKFCVKPHVVPLYVHDCNYPIIPPPARATSN
eukprot:gb/GECH01014565.1/.p1 GENE.gb/GECH01014565.1/~~gb/GECH01014565.1/.p1  ORF type:complete len:419 (+),score=117.59 gb/GECH01014565.1/:1-1257(+)